MGNFESLAGSCENYDWMKIPRGKNYLIAAALRGKTNNHNCGTIAFSLHVMCGIRYAVVKSGDTM
jgi:hypothetical protein